MERSEWIALEARKELARRYFYEYAKLRYGKFYKDDRHYLEDLCNRLQGFVEQNTKRFMVVNMPPRHGKSFTTKNFTEWLFGKDPALKVMTGSYNEKLSSTFAAQVRDTIDEQTTGTKVVYNDIFPFTKIKYGEASSSVWALEGSTQKSYLATSPTGTATGFGANIILIDDIIKNAEEAYNDAVLEKHWDWFNNTLMQRTEGDNWKFIIIMTRWASADLAGRILEEFPDVEHITYKAVQDDGSMLSESILNKEDFALKTRNMNLDIVEANYNQQPIDVKGRLFGEFTTYDSLPEGEFKKWNYTDTADTGADFLCSVDYIEHGDDVYVTDVYISDAGMEVTEPKVAEMLHTDGVNHAFFESNNGGRGFARNVERILHDTYSDSRCVIEWKAQTKNKEARILASSAWVQKHIIMPHNWQNKWPEFFKQLSKYQRKGKNAHDDAPDVLAAIYERVANPASAGVIGFYRRQKVANEAEAEQL